MFDRWFGKRLAGIMKKRSCYHCTKQHTMRCPNSSECYSTENKPHFELDPKKV